MSDTPTEFTDEDLLALIPLTINGTGTVTLPDGTIPQEEN